MLDVGKSLGDEAIAQWGGVSGVETTSKKGDKTAKDNHGFPRVQGAGEMPGPLLQ